MDCHRATDQTDCHGQFDGAAQVAVRILLPVGQRRVCALVSGVGVGTRLDGAPILPAGEGDGRDGVHDALVVRGGPEGVSLGEMVGLDDAVDHLPTRVSVISGVGEFCGGEGRAHPCQSVHGQVADDAQDDSPAGDRLHSWSDRFRHRVDRVRTHRISAVDEDVHDDHLARFGVQHAGFDILASTPESDEDRVHFVAPFHELILGVQNGLFRGLWIGTFDHLDLADHDGVRVVAGEPPFRVASLGHVGGRSHHARLLESEGYEVVFIVDDEVGRHPYRQGQGSDHILDDPVRRGLAQLPHLGPRLDLLI